MGNPKFADIFTWGGRGKIFDRLSKEYKNKSLSFWSKAIGSTYFSWMARFLTVNFLIMAFVSGADQVLIFGRQLVMWVILLISPTPGGAGVAEFVFSGFLGDLIPFGLAGIFRDGFKKQEIITHIYLINHFHFL